MNLLLISVDIRAQKVVDKVKKNEDLDSDDIQKIVHIAVDDLIRQTTPK
jgi:hypothetical protein